MPIVMVSTSTVSTDYDMCDRLYFDELTYERVMDVIELENPHGVVVSVGGQIPNNLALRLDKSGVPILGTKACNIDKAEDRNKFSSIVDALGVDQPEWSELTTMDDVDKFIDKVGFPVLVRPSYVLSGAAMNVCYDEEQLRRFLSLASDVSQEHPVVISKFMDRCKEIEFDAVADEGEILAYAISEHIEYAGVHSGDATIQFPPQKLYVETVRRIKKIARKIAGALQISGPFNIQFLAKENKIKVIECNLRASRSFPFVSKVLKINFIELATKVMLGKHPAAPQKSAFDLDYVGVKSSQFSFARLEEADPMLGVDMSSTGEMRMVPVECRATIGVVGNGDHNLINLGKAGRKRHMGWRPTVRGSVMNPNDHPHGGGEGKAPVGRPGPCTPWGKPALGLKTRNKKKASNKLIIRRRDGRAIK